MSANLTIEVFTSSVVVVDGIREIATFPVLACGGEDKALAHANRFLASEDMLAALILCADMAWEETRDVKFSSELMFSKGYGGFDALDCCRQEIHSRAGSFMIWPSQIGGKALWSVYGGPDESLWFETFDSEDKAKQCAVGELSVICPDHPSVIARAAIARAHGETP